MKKNETWDIWYSQLGPSIKLHADAYGKNRKAPISRLEYRRRYLREMKNKIANDLIICLAKLAIEGGEITLLCSSACTDENACHRTILKVLIQKAAVDLREKSA